MDEPTNFVDRSTIKKLTPLEQVKLQAQVVVSKRSRSPLSKPHAPLPYTATLRRSFVIDGGWSCETSEYSIVKVRITDVPR